MKISESWLREWVNPDLDTAALGLPIPMEGETVEGTVVSVGREHACQHRAGVGVVVAVLVEDRRARVE